MKKKIIGFTAIVILAVVLGFVGRSIFDEEKTEIMERPAVKVGVIYPLSGNAAALGQAAQNATRMYLENFESSSHPFRYQIIFEDSELNDDKAVVIAERMIGKDDVDALVTIGSEIGEKVSKIAEMNRIVHLSVATDEAAAEGKYNFMITSSGKKESAEPVKFEGVAYGDAATAEFAEDYKNEFKSDDTQYSEYLYAAYEVLTNAFGSVSEKDYHNSEMIADKILQNTNSMQTAAGTVNIDERGVIDAVSPL